MHLTPKVSEFLRDSLKHAMNTQTIEKSEDLEVFFNIKEVGQIISLSLGDGEHLGVSSTFCKNKIILLRKEVEKMKNLKVSLIKYFREEIIKYNKWKEMEKNSKK